jgi:hypothetical protein
LTLRRRRTHRTRGGSNRKVSDATSEVVDSDWRKFAVEFKQQHPNLPQQQSTQSSSIISNRTISKSNGYLNESEEHQEKASAGVLGYCRCKLVFGGWVGKEEAEVWGQTFSTATKIKRRLLLSRKNFILLYDEIYCIVNQGGGWLFGWGFWLLFWVIFWGVVFWLLQKKHKIPKTFFLKYQVPDMIREDPEYFFETFRMTPAAFDELLGLVGPKITKSSKPRESITAAQRLQMTLAQV